MLNTRQPSRKLLTVTPKILKCSSAYPQILSASVSCFVGPAWTVWELPNLYIIMMYVLQHPCSVFSRRIFGQLVSTVVLLAVCLAAGQASHNYKPNWWAEQEDSQLSNTTSFLLFVVKTCCLWCVTIMRTVQGFLSSIGGSRNWIWELTSTTAAK